MSLRPPFWLAISSGVIAFAAINIAYDVPHRMELGNHAERTGRIQDELRRFLSNFEHAELLAASSRIDEYELEHQYEHELIKFNDSVTELESLIEHYREASLYNPAIANSAETFSRSMDEWITRKRAETLFAPGNRKNSNNPDTHQTGLHQLLHAQADLGEGEMLIHQDIDNKRSAIQVLQVSGAMLLAYLLALVIYIQIRRTQEVMRSLAERKRAHNTLEEVVRERTRELQLQAQIINQIHDSVVSTDLNGLVTSWNKGAENLFGYSESEAVGQPISFVYPEEELEHLLSQVIAPLKQKGAHETEVTMRRKDGRNFQAMLSLSMLYGEDGSPEGMIGYSLDITARKKAEAALLKQADTLEAANQELEAFSYSVSHDLRAPLRSIDGFSQALLDDYHDKLDEAGKDYLNRVRNASQRMARLIDDMLDLSRVSRHELRRKTLDISAIADSVVRKLVEHNADRSVRITIHPGLQAEGDSRLIETALDNLIGNAWKYTSNCEEAEIEVGSRNDAGETVFYVRDNGAGFDMNYADKLFGTFQRLHGSEFEGTGIGLATVLRIVTRHGGRIWGEGEPGKGATFYFTLPSQS